ncbi:induced myeloid leukemia cell differentiation protein Mcl-1b [Takifugu flavidus]|uniref:Induced myeloid leukemia cell differentiation protein n=1 Tax=Takifugu flavidus TaxID=433684 RepID=A0A5C6PK25_9TELE|nr:induced myeloid leukemia cell differentiation protein Mcl-1b [Takifugu flavidus]TWW79765.1 Induced myeloid leukemia cell differentiation protein [Takifugu flavidus]
MNIITDRTALQTMNMMFQNGVVDGAGHSSPLIPMASRGSLSGNDSPKRPSKLSVIAPILRKAIQEGSQDIERSAPSTPEINSVNGLDVSGRPAEDEAALDNDTRQLLSRFMADFCGIGSHQWRESGALSTMKRVVANLMDKHRYVYNGMTKQLTLDDRGDDVSFVSSVAKSIFADGVTNWGRIASLVAFGAVVAQHMKDNGRRDCVEPVAQEISTYLLTDRRDWLIKNNGWEGFVEFFQVSDPESSVRNMLMAFAGVAGLGATLALLIR